MGKKRQPPTWEEAAKLCDLHDDDIQKAKRLGFLPHKLIQSIPGPREFWKSPVKEWVSDLYEDRFGEPPPPHVWTEEELEAVRIFGERLYWEDYFDRNADVVPKQPRAARAAKGKSPPPKKKPAPAWTHPESISDDDVPF